MNAYLSNERIHLRAYEPEDADDVAEIRSSPEIAKFLIQKQPMNMAQWRESLLSNKSQIQLAIIHTERDEIAGEVSLYRIDEINRSAGFGIYIAPFFQNFGLGGGASKLLINHAFKTLNFNRLWLRVLSHNAIAIRLYQDLGFKQEGTLRKDIYCDGGYCDTIMMSLLREEWQ